MATHDTIFWERAAALSAVAALVSLLAASNISCGGQDLVFSGDFPTATPVQTTTPTMTETPEPDEG